MNRCLTKNGIQLFTQGGQHLLHNAFGVGISQRPVVGTKFHRECHTLLALGNTGAAVDVKEFHTAQQLAGGSGDDAFNLRNGNSLVADEGQVTGGRLILGQGLIGGIRQNQSKELGKVDLGAVNFAVQALGFGNQRMDVSHITQMLTAD